jgi:hypothetical protein
MSEGDLDRNNIPSEDRWSSLIKDAGAHEKSRIRDFLLKLKGLPAPGLGLGCHPALLGAANVGVRTILDDQDLEDLIRAAIPPGSRDLAPEEIRDAIRKARAEAGQPFAARPPGSHARGLGVPRMSPEEVLRDQQQRRKKLLAAAGGPLDPDNPALRASSPVPIDWPCTQGMVHLLETLYDPREFVYIGHQQEGGEDQRRAVRTAAEWMAFFQGCQLSPEELGHRFSHIGANPLTGQPGMAKNGKPSFRCDDCVASHRYAMVEFDGIPKAEQVAIEMYLFQDTLACLIDSGGKSVHAWVRVDMPNAEEWGRQIERRFFPELGMLGVDLACKNECRLSRLPGILRPDKGQYQRLLWLRGKGGAV